MMMIEVDFFLVYKKYMILEKREIYFCFFVNFVFEFCIGYFYVIINGKLFFFKFCKS